MHRSGSVVLMWVCLVSFSCTDNNPQPAFLKDGELLLSTGKLDSAASVFQRGIDQCGGTEQIEECYVLNDSCLQETISEHVRTLPKGRAPSSDFPKGTICVWIGSREDGTVDSLSRERIKFAESYLARFPHGQNVVRFERTLFWSYSLADSAKQLPLATKLYMHSKDEHVRSHAGLVSAWYAHCQGRYPEAIDRYERLESEMTDSFDRIRMKFYIADCLYRQDHTLQAQELLKTILLSDSDPNRVPIAEMAKQWLKVYQQIIDNPHMVRTELVFFR